MEVVFGCFYIGLKMAIQDYIIKLVNLFSRQVLHKSNINNKLAKTSDLF